MEEIQELKEEIRHMGPSGSDHVRPEMSVATEEIFARLSASCTLLTVDEALAIVPETIW